jgi:hypothetical protein
LPPSEAPLAGHSSCRVRNFDNPANLVTVLTMAKGQERPKKENKPKLSTKEKQQKKKEKKAAKTG